MIVFKKLIIKNFLSYDEYVLEFKPSLTLIQGYNGSGKSALFESIYWCLYGTTPRGIQTSDVIRKGTNFCSVTLEFEKDSNVYKVVRTRDNKGGRLEFYQNGEKISFSDMRKTEELINKIINFSLFKNIFISGTNFKSFVLASDKEKKQLFMNFLGLDKIEEARQKAKNILIEIENKITEIKTSITENINFREKLIKEKNDKEKEIINLNEKKNRLDDLIKIKNDILSFKQNLNSEIECLQRSLNDLNNLKINTELKIFEVTNNLLNKGKKLTEVKERKNNFVLLKQKGICPVCGSIVSSDYVDSKIEIFDSQLKNLEEEYKNLEFQLNELKRKSQQINESISHKVDLINIKNKTIQKFDEEIILLEKEIKELETIFDNINKRIKEIENSIKEIDIKIKEKEKELELIKEDYEVYDFWYNKGFSSQGFVHYILSIYLSAFNENLNNYLTKLFDRPIRAEFKPFTYLKTGEIREKWDFDIYGFSGIDNYHNCSSGERRRIDIAIYLALNSFLNIIFPVNLLILDEVLDPLDDVGCELVINLLIELKQKGLSIFVISHNEKLTSIPIFDRILKVEKINNISKIL